MEGLLTFVARRYDLALDFSRISGDIIFSSDLSL
jgi:hypothetical protein